MKQDNKKNDQSSTTSKEQSGRLLQSNCLCSIPTPVHGPVIKQCLIRVDACFPSPHVTLQVPLIQGDQGLQAPTKE